MTRTHRPIWRAALLLLALGACPLLGGCATSEVSNRIGLTPNGTAEIEVRNQGLQKDCELRDGGVVLYEDKIMACWVLLQSHLDERQTLECRWTWEDRDGFVIKGTRAWKSVFVNAQEEHKVEGRAPGPQAVRGTFELRYHSGQTDGDE